MLPVIRFASEGYVINTGFIPFKKQTEDVFQTKRPFTTIVSTKYYKRFKRTVIKSK